jgi:hypothetical protein
VVRDTPAHHVTRRGVVEAELRVSSGFFQKATDRQTYIHRVPLGKKTHDEWIGMYEEAVLTYRHRLTQRRSYNLSRRHNEHLQKRDPGSPQCDSREENCQLYLKRLDLRTSVTIRLNKKDVNADATVLNMVERLRK